MNKMIAKISAAALSAAMVLGNGVVLSAGAEGEETTVPAVVSETAAPVETTEPATQPPTESAPAETSAETTASVQTEAPTATTSAVPAASITIGTIAGSWVYQVANGNTTVDQSAKDNGSVEITKEGTFTYTDTTGKKTTGTVVIGTEEIAGTTLTTVNFYEGTTLSFGGYYRSNGEISIGNGGTARLVRPSSAAPATTQAATTTKAASTTTKANTNDSPKTGDSFPALAISAALLSAAALSITTKKRNK